MRTNSAIKNLLGLSLLSLASTGASAATCSSYATGGLSFHDATTVCYVWDPAQIDGKFGTPSFSGDTIFFPGISGFRAESTGTEGPVLESGTLNLQIIAKDGFTLSDINVAELGDYEMSSGASTASVDVDAWTRVYDWANPLGGLFGGGTESIKTFTPATPLTSATGNPVNWSLSGSHDITNPEWEGINHVGFTLQNNLEAISNSSTEYAWIQKKAGGVNVEVTTIPIPAAVWLFGTGLISLIGLARRRGH